MEPTGVIIVAIVSFTAGFILTKWRLSKSKSVISNGSGNPLPSDKDNKENQNI